MNLVLSHLRLRALCVAALLLLGVALAIAAPVMPPPIDAMWDRDAILAEATYVDQPSPHRLRFVDVDVVHGGEARDEVTVQVDDNALALVQPGKRYVLAWQETQRSPSTKKLRVMRAEGPQLLMSAGANPALFEARPETRELLLQPPTPERLEGREHLRRAMAGLRSADPQMQALFAAELFARSALREQLGASERRRLRAFVLRVDRAYEARSMILEAALIYPAHYGSDWTRVAARVIRHEPVSALPGQPNEGLVWSAFGLLQRDAVSVPLAHLTRWVASGNGALSELALHAVRRQAPERELAMIDEALADEALAAGTREFLLDHRRRLLLSRASEG